MPTPDGPPNKWTSFNATGMTGQQVLDQLNALAAQGYKSIAVSVVCTDGLFVFVGGYKK